MTFTTSKSSVRIKALAALAGLALLNGCLDEAPDDSTSSDVTGGGPNIVTDWAGIAADAILRPVEESTALGPLGPGAMLMAQVQLAVYDAVIAVEGDYESFSYHKDWRDVDLRAAVATAAYRVLKTRVPGRGAYLDTQYASSMNAISGGRKKTRGVALGEEVAAHYIALRANDNLGNTYTWTQPTPGPGVFEPTVAGAQPADYKMLFVPPYTYGISQTSWFFPPPPPALSSSAYATAWNETRTVGGATSTARTEAQRQLALWASEHPFRWSARNLNELAVAKGLSVPRAARFFALAWTSMADTLQTGWSAKYHYNLWRPIHSVPRADTDGNDATTADPTWTPLLNVNHPEYPAGHGLVGAGAVVEAVRAFFRTDRVTWTLTSVGVNGLTETTRSYTSLDALANDIMNARIYAGLHYRFSVNAGRNQAKAVVNYIKARHFEVD